MVDDEYSPDNYETLKISIVAIIKNPEMLLWPFVIRYVAHLYKTQEICDKWDKVILENCRMLKFIIAS